MTSFHDASSRIGRRYPISSKSRSDASFARRLSLPFVLLCFCLLAGGVSLNFFSIRHENISFVDKSRGRNVDVDLYVNRLSEARARSSASRLPVAIVSHGYTVRHSEYSFISKLLAAHGYLVASIQHDLVSDAPLSETGSLYVGRMPMYERGAENIKFAIAQLEALEPEADFANLTMVGHSNGGDISMFFAGRNPDIVSKVITLDNLRVPFIMHGAARILTFRSKDRKPDAGVVPNAALARRAGIQVVMTDAQHVDMSDRGPAEAKKLIQEEIGKFLAHDDARPEDIVVQRRAELYSTATP